MAAETAVTHDAMATFRGAADVQGRLRAEVVEGGSQLELMGTESDDRLDKKISRKIDAVNGVFIRDAAEKQRLEEKQIELYADGE